MTDPIEEARALLANLRSQPWRRDRDMVQGAGCILVANCIDADAAGFIAAAPRLLAALIVELELLRGTYEVVNKEAVDAVAECERLRKQNTEYHRRAQVAEAAVAEEAKRGHRAGRSVGRSLANAAASTYMRECDRLRAELAAAREAMPDDDGSVVLWSLYQAACEHATQGGTQRTTNAAERQLADARAVLRRLDAYRAAHPETPPIAGTSGEGTRATALDCGVPPSRGEIGGPSGRCEICDWPYSASRKKGCVPGDCSYRPPHGSTEALRIAARRRELAAAQPTPSADQGGDHG